MLIPHRRLVRRVAGAALTALLSLAPTSTARAQPIAEQSSWAGGPGAGVVTDWDERFDRADSISWLAVPGQIALTGEPLGDPRQRLVAANAGMPVTVGVGDLDGDGSLEIVSSDAVTQVLPEALGAIYSWRRDGDAWHGRIVDADFYGAQHVGTADIDGDGDDDVIASAYYGEIDPPPPPPATRNGRYAWFENLDGAGGAWRQHVVGELFWGARFIDSADFDGDGDLDLVGASDLTDGIWEQESDVTWFENADGRGTSWIQHDLELFYDNAYQAHGIDLDRDGDADIVATRPSEISWWENESGNGTVWTKRTVADFLSNVGLVDAADIDGDGDLDLLGGSFSSSSLFWWENLDGEATSWALHFVAGLFHSWVLELGDLDGDADPDVLVSTTDPGAAFWIENHNGGAAWQLRTVELLLPSPTWIAIGDVDDDGRLDAVASTNDPFGEEDEQISFFDLTATRRFGLLASAVLDGGEDTDWRALAWDATIPPGTTLEVAVRAADDPDALGHWIPVPASGAGLDGLIDPAARFLQTRVSLEATGPDSAVVRALAVYRLGLTAPFPGIPGETSTLTAAWRGEGDPIDLLTSTAEGTTPLPGCPDLSLDLAAPRHLGRADATNGEALFAVEIPQTLAGRRVHFQAVQRAACATGPRVTVDLPE